MRSVATGSSSSRCGRRRGGHRGDAAQGLAGHPQRRLLRADAGGRRARARAAARPCAGMRRAASGRPRTPCRAARCGARPARARGASGAAPSAAAPGSPCLPCATAARAWAAAPTASRSAASSAAAPRRAGAAAPRGGGWGGCARARAARTRWRRSPARTGRPRREAGGVHVQGDARGASATTLTASSGTRRVVMCSLSSSRGQSGLPRQGEQGRCMLFRRCPWAPSGGVVQSVRTPACHAGGRGFESRRSRSRFHLQRAQYSNAPDVEIARTG